MADKVFCDLDGGSQQADTAGEASMITAQMTLKIQVLPTIMINPMSSEQFHHGMAHPIPWYIRCFA